MHLAPPVLAKADPVTGTPRKRAFGPWMFRAMGLLRHGKALRGTALDPFGRTEERRMERALPGEFRAGVERLLVPTPGACAADWAEAWAGVKGFGHDQGAQPGSDAGEARGDRGAGDGGGVTHAVGSSTWGALEKGFAPLQASPHQRPKGLWTP